MTGIDFQDLGFAETETQHEKNKTPPPVDTKHSMAIPYNKNELQHYITGNYQKLTEMLSSIPPEWLSSQDLEGHTRNSRIRVQELLAYLVGWGQLVLKWNDLKSKGLEVDFPETGFKWNQLGMLAHKFYQDYKKDDYLTLRKKLDQTVQEILALIESKTQEELYEIPWYGKWTLGRMIQLNTASPYRNATGRLRTWKKRMLSP